MNHHNMSTFHLYSNFLFFIFFDGASLQRQNNSIYQLFKTFMMKFTNLFNLLLVAVIVTFIGTSCTNEAIDLEKSEDASLLLLQEKMPSVYGLIDKSTFETYAFQTEAGDDLLLKGYRVVQEGEADGYYLEHDGEMIYTSFSEEAIVQVNLTTDQQIAVARKLDRETNLLVPDFEKTSTMIIESYQDNANRGLCEIACNIAMGACMAACGVGTGVVALADSPLPGPADAAAVALFAACTQACVLARNECYYWC